MSIDLMTKRIKVIGDYPFNKYHKLGSIYTDDEKYAVLDENGNAVVACEWEKYPTVFEILPWWTEREVADMPEYAKDLENNLKGKVYRVLERGLCIGFKDNLVAWINCLPATLEEYQEYQSKKQAQ